MGDSRAGLRRVAPSGERPRRSGLGGLGARLGLVVPLGCATVLILAAKQVSDIGAVRRAELTHGRPFEYPALARPLYLAERAISGSVMGISVVNLIVMATCAVVMVGVLRDLGADLTLWTSAPILVLAGQNWDVLTALTMALALRSWQRREDWRAGLWIGLGTAFKLVPALMLVPFLAAGGWRRTGRAMVMVLAVVLVTNLPMAVRNPTAWWFPYKFAGLRPDHDGTIWAALPLSGRAINLGSLALLACLLLAIFLAVRSRRLSVASGTVLSVLAFIVSNKVWQPHYVLWALPALAVAHTPRRPVRVLEWASLAWFLTLWRRAPLVHAGAWNWTVGSARLASLLLVATVVVGHGQLRAASDVDGSDAMSAGRPDVQSARKP